MEEKKVEYRIYRVIESEDSGSNISEELIATKRTMQEAHDYVNNSVKISQDEMAHRKFFYRKYFQVANEIDWQLDSSIGNMGVGAKTAKGLLEDLESERLDD